MAKAKSEALLKAEELAEKIRPPPSPPLALRSSAGSLEVSLEERP